MGCVEGPAAGKFDLVHKVGLLAEVELGEGWLVVMVRDQHLWMYLWTARYILLFSSQVQASG